MNASEFIKKYFLLVNEDTETKDVAIPFDHVVNLMEIYNKHKKDPKEKIIDKFEMFAIIQTNKVSFPGVNILKYNNKITKTISGGEFRRLLSLGAKPHHIYKLSNDDIREYDLVYNSDYNEVYFATKALVYNNKTLNLNLLKVISSTDFESTPKSTINDLEISQYIEYLNNELNEK